MKFPTEWKVIKTMFQTTNQVISWVISMRYSRGVSTIPSVDGITHNLSLNSDAMAEVLITTPPKKKYIHSFPRHGGWKPLGKQQPQPNARNPRYFFLKVCFWSSDISDLWLTMVFHAGKRRNCQVCPWANSSWNPRICEFPMGFSPWVFRHVFSSGKLPAGSTGIQHFYAVRVI